VGGFVPFLRSVLLLAAVCIISSCVKNDSSVIDPQGTSPFVLSASISPTAVNLDTASQNDNLVVTISVKVRQGSSTISSVNCSILDYLGGDVLASGSLLDNGLFPDAIAGDSIFSGQLTIPVASLIVEDFYCQIEAQSTNGGVSNSYILALRVYRQSNRPPVLSDLQCPDTISLGSFPAISFPITVRATDPDGQSDIAKVFFNSYKPNGSPANGNPFQMYDDGSETIIYPPEGTSGDRIKGDSIYTLTVTIDSSNAKGPYRFDFQAVDRSNAYSNTLTKYILVTQ
jgi:hypothetical protein